MELKYIFNTSGDLADLGERVNITIYRIVQECLTNVAKYAKAAQVTINLSANSGGRVLSVGDDGRGMNLSIPGSGLGLIGMRERDLFHNVRTWQGFINNCQSVRISHEHFRRA